MQLTQCKGLISTAFAIATISRVCCELPTDRNFVQDVTFQFNRTTFVKIVQQIDFLSLHLRYANETSNSFVDFILKQLFPIQLTVSKNIHFTEAQRHRAVTINSEKDLEITLNRHAHRGGILLCIILHEVRERHLLKLAHKLWQEKGVYKIYYIRSDATVFYNPFVPINDGTQYGALINPDHMTLEDITHNLHGYPMRIYIFDSVYSNTFGDPDGKRVTHVTGADSQVAKLLSDNMNFTMLLQWPDDEFFGSHLANGSYNGAIGRTMRYETDVTLTGFFVKDYLTKEIEFTVPVYMDQLCCYVMKAKRIPQSIAPLFAVKVDMWIGFFVVGMMSSCVWIVIHQLNLRIHTIVRDPGRNTRFHNVRIFIDTWVVWVRLNLIHFPLFHSERMFVISLSLVSVIFGALFESSLATFYIRPLYYKDINSLRELDDANFRIYIKHAAIKDDLFYGHNSEVYKSLDRKLLLVGETEERIIQIMIKRGGFAAVTRASSLLLDDFPYFAAKKIHKINECPKKYHIAYLMQKQSPYRRRINSLLLRYLQAGLINQWIGLRQHEAKLSVYKYQTKLMEQSYIWKVLTLDDLQLAFYILILFSILAILTWFGEMLLYFKFLNCTKKQSI